MLHYIHEETSRKPDDVLHQITVNCKTLQKQLNVASLLKFSVLYYIYSLLNSH